MTSVNRAQKCNQSFSQNYNSTVVFGSRFRGAHKSVALGQKYSAKTALESTKHFASFSPVYRKHTAGMMALLICKVKQLAWALLFQPTLGTHNPFCFKCCLTQYCLCTNKSAINRAMLARLVPQNYLIALKENYTAKIFTMIINYAFSQHKHAICNLFLAFDLINCSNTVNICSHLEM